MDFDVSSSGQWQALFTKTESTTLSTSQQTNLHYNLTDPAILSKLQDRLVFLYIHISKENQLHLKQLNINT